MGKLEYGKEILKKAKGKWSVTLTYYIIIAVTFFSISKASLTTYNFMPFATPLLFSLFWCGLNPYLLGTIFLSASLILDFTQKNITVVVISFIIVVVAGIVHKKIKKSPSLIECYVLLLLSYIAQVFLYVIDIKTGLAMLLCVLSGIAFMYACTSFLASTVKRGFSIKLNLDEKLCGGIILVVASIGLGELSIYNFEIIKVFTAIIILVATYTSSTGSTIVLGAVMGLGYAITATNSIYIAAFVCYALGSVAFKINYRILSCFGIVIAEILFGLYFKNYLIFGLQSVVSVCVGCVIFLILPKKVLAYVKEILSGFHNKIAARNIVNRSKENVCKRILEIGEVFKEMDTVFRSMVKGSLNEQGAKEVLANELVQKVCVSCAQCNKCLRVDGEYTTEVLKDLIDAGYEKGRATVIDVSQYLSSRCIKLNHLINTFNNLLDNYKTHSNIISSLDASRVLIADQLGGVSHIMKQFVNEINKNITFDLTSENNLIEELAYKNVACVEAIVYEQDTYEKNVTLLVKNNSIKEKTIEKIVSKVCKNDMEVVGIAPSELPNVSVINLKTKLNYDIVFGSATLSKNKDANGDAHSIIKIANGKYLLAVCDGMGNGIGAKETSGLAISLIENFYKAGFENEMILNSVNKLLALGGDEKFSALDLCVLDMRKNSCDFIKLGSPVSYIKHKNSTEEVVGSGLPMGIVDEMHPHSKKIFLHPFDTIILVSDGVSDVYDKDTLKTIINNITSINPQSIADEIMLVAKKKLGGVVRDDMTVLVARIFPTAY